PRRTCAVRRATRRAPPMPPRSSGSPPGRSGRGPRPRRTSSAWRGWPPGTRWPPGPPPPAASPPPSRTPRAGRGRYRSASCRREPAPAPDPRLRYGRPPLRPPVRPARRRARKASERWSSCQVRSSMRRTYWMLTQGTRTWLTTVSTLPPSATVRCTSKTRPTASACSTVQSWYAMFPVLISLSLTPTASAVVSIAPSVVILQPQVRDQLLASKVPQRVLELHELDEEVVLRIEPGGGHGALEIEGQPLLDAAHLRARGEVQEQGEVEHNGGGEDGVAAEEVHLDLHRVPHPAEDVDVVPALLVVPPRRVVVDAHEVVDLAVEVRVDVRLEDVLEHAELGYFLRLEGLGILEDLAVAVAQDVGGEPALQAEGPRLDRGGGPGPHRALSGLEALSRDRRARLLRQLEQRGDVGGEVGRPVGVRDAPLDRRVRVDHRGQDLGIALLEAALEPGQGRVDLARLAVDLGRPAPHHHQPREAALLAEAVDVRLD